MFTSLVSHQNIKDYSHDEESNYSNIELYSFNFTNSESLNFSYSIPSVNNVINTVQAFQFHYFDIELGNLITNKIATQQKEIVHFPHNFTAFKKLFPFHYYS
ncbi:MAG: hypothetical protein R2836_04345 [Chitinophagales bacterium]